MWNKRLITKGHLGLSEENKEKTVLSAVKTTLKLDSKFVCCHFVCQSNSIRLSPPERRTKPSAEQRL